MNSNNGEELYSSYPSYEIECDFQREELKNIEFLRGCNMCFKAYLDEYRVSRMLKNVLKRMKKSEDAEIIVKGDKYIKFGVDYEILKDKNILSPFSELKYYVTVYNFVEVSLSPLIKNRIIKIG